MFLKIGVILKNRYRKLFSTIFFLAAYFPKKIVWGKTFINTYNFLLKSENWNRDQIEKYQLKMIQETIEHAYKYVPYYTELFDKHNIHPNDIQSIEDLQKIPFLTKEIIKENYEKFISTDIKEGEYLIDYTGGSTSEPMKFIVDSEFIPRELAFFKYVWEKVGYSLGTKCIELKGAKVAIPDKNIYWKYDPVLKLLKVDSDYISDNHALIYIIDELKRFNSPYIIGFPSSIFLLAKQIEKHGNLTIPQIEVIMLASENTYQWQIEYIKKVFKCQNIFYHYGHSEKGAVAVKCLKSQKLHFLSQYGYVELVGNSELSEIVVTSYCKSFPLIRYKTKDFAIKSDTRCDCEWGNHLTVENIEGRLQEFIVTRDKRLVSICSMGAAHFEILNQILSTQYYQDTIGKLEFRVVPFKDREISEDIKKSIKNEIEKKLDYSIDVEVIKTEKIVSLPSGKHQMIDQHLNISDFIDTADFTIYKDYPSQYVTSLKKYLPDHKSITTQALSILPYYFEFFRVYLLLKRSQQWKSDQINKYQMEQLSKLLHHAYENVPYYTRVFNENGIKPEDIKDISDLKKLPFLTKEIVRQNLNELKATNYPITKFEYVTTGGSTGIPMGFFYEKGRTRAIEWAFIKKQWDCVGYHFLDKCVILKGSVVQSNKEKRFSEKTLFGRWLILSSYDMTEKNLPDYIKQIQTFNPKFIQAYPSSITILAHYLKNNNIEPFNSIQAIFCGSETMYPGQRELIENVFKCRVYSWYGHAERVVLAGECEQSKKYHVFPEYGIFDLVDEKGESITQAEREGTIVGTGLTNYVMPLIRYKTDDLAMYSSNQQCQCNREYTLIENVKGRWTQEFIIAPDNRKISVTALNMHSDVFDNVRQFQFYQDTIGEVTLNIVKNEMYTEKDNLYIYDELIKKLGDDISLKISFVDHIERTPSGKFRFLIKKLPVN
jgi:phenylacetate-CoA ligase